MGGLWEVIGLVGFASNGTGYRLARLARNGAFLDSSQLPATPGTTHAQQVVTGAVLNAGDVLTLTALQNSGGALDITSAWLIVNYRGPAT